MNAGYPTADARTAHQVRYLSVGDFDIELTRKRVRNINIRVRRDGSIAVSAPARVPLAEIKRIVLERADWIARQRNRMRSAAPTTRTWNDGDMLTLWGRPVTLRIVFDSDGDERAWHVGNTVELHLSSAREENERATRSHRSRLFDELLTQEMKDALVTLLPHCERRVGKRAGAIRLRRMVSRWGSCNVETARIALNLELAERSPVCLEAVLCHELCHLHERCHNERFYAHLSQACPNWREARALLRKAAPQRP